VLGVEGVASLLLLSVPMTVGWHFQYVREWLPAYGIRYHVAVDGISLWLVLLTTLTTPIAATVSFGSIRRRTKELCFALLLLQGAMLGAFVALDLFLFYVFWELLLVPMFIIIACGAGWSGSGLRTSSSSTPWLAACSCSPPSCTSPGRTPTWRAT
jgi:NADH-quinone oxidoreductase subunit M